MTARQQRFSNGIIGSLRPTADSFVLKAAESDVTDDIENLQQKDGVLAAKLRQFNFDIKPGSRRIIDQVLHPSSISAQAAFVDLVSFFAQSSAPQTNADVGDLMAMMMAAKDRAKRPAPIDLSRADAEAYDAVDPDTASGVMAGGYEPNLP